MILIKASLSKMILGGFAIQISPFDYRLYNLDHVKQVDKNQSCGEDLTLLGHGQSDSTLRN